MQFNEYQQKANETAIYPNRGSNLIYPTLGLCGETGEVAEKVKKLMRDGNGIPDPAFKEMITKELGDVLWYLAQMCTELGITLEEMAQMNISKLASRKERGQLHGSGDNR